MSIKKADDATMIQLEYCSCVQNFI